MRLISLTGKYLPPQSCVGVFGCFDGVHKGHSKLIKSALSFAKNEGSPLVVWALSIKRNDLLCSPRDKISYLEALGADAVIAEDYENIRDLSPDEFLCEMSETFGVRHLFCGYNFTFGKGRKGNSSNITEFCKNHRMTPHVMDEYKTNFNSLTINVSSSAARAALKKGDIELASAILGRTIVYRGVVTSGRAIGRTLGFPTANIIPYDGIILPRFGVYLSELDCEGRKYISITNIGVRPTFDGNGASIESFIMSDIGEIDLYGKEIAVGLKHFIRDEKKFESAGELAAQIQKDIKECKKIMTGE